MISMYSLKVKIVDLIFTCSLILILGFQTNYFLFEKNLTTVLLCVFFVFLLANKKDIPKLRYTGKYILWYGLFICYCVMSKMWSLYDNSNYIYALVKDTFIPMLVVLIMMEIQLRDGAFKVIDSLIIASTVAVLRAVAHTPILTLITTMDTRYFAAGLGVSYNNYTTLLTLVALVTAFMVSYKDKKYTKICLFFLLLIVFTGSRKAILITAAGLALIYFFSGKLTISRVIKRTLLAIVAEIGVWIAIHKIPFLYDLVGYKLDMAIFSILNPDQRVTKAMDLSIYARQTLRESAWNFFKAYPVTGIGYNCFSSTNQWNYYTHSNYLELLANLGGIGFFLYYSMYISRMVVYLYKFRRYKIAQFALSFLVMLMGLEYAQITFMRPFALIPLILVMVCADYLMDKGEIIHV